MTEPGRVPRDCSRQLLLTQHTSGRAIRRNSKELLPLPALPLTASPHGAAALGDSPHKPPEPPQNPTAPYNTLQPPTNTPGLGRAAQVRLHLGNT